MAKKTAKWSTLDGVLEEIWKMLDRGASRFNDAFHWPVLGTVSDKGCSQRTVIFRQFRQAERLLVCNTDARASKAEEIRQDDRVSWLFYHPKKKVQLRVSGIAVLHTNDQFADDQWAKTPATNRLNYNTDDPPGTPIKEPAVGLSDLLMNKLPTLLESEKTRKNFMTISCQLDTIDWVLLSPLGNRRARFDWIKNELTATWLVP